MPTQWQCNMCMEKQDEAYVSSVITAIGEELVKLEKGSEETCKSFIIKHSQNLHPNHFYLMDVKLALCQMLGKGGPEKNGGGAGGGGGGVEHAKEKELVLKQKLCMEILDVVNKISPGKREQKKLFLFSCFKSIIHRDFPIARGRSLRAPIHTINLCKKKIQPRRNQFTTFKEHNAGKWANFASNVSCVHETSPFFALIQEVVNYLKECIQIFSYEPSCLQEGRLTAIARLDLVEAETFIDSIGTAPGATAETTDPKESK